MLDQYGFRRAGNFFRLLGVSMKAALFFCPTRMSHTDAYNVIDESDHTVLVFQDNFDMNGVHVKSLCPPKAKVTRSNRVGCANTPPLQTKATLRVSYGGAVPRTCLRLSPFG